jgi:hypothetical protein
MYGVHCGGGCVGSCGVCCSGLPCGCEAQSGAAGGGARALRKAERPRLHLIGGVSSAHAALQGTNSTTCRVAAVTPLALAGLGEHWVPGAVGRHCAPAHTFIPGGGRPCALYVLSAFCVLRFVLLRRPSVHCFFVEKKPNFL